MRVRPLIGWRWQSVPIVAKRLECGVFQHRSSEGDVWCRYSKAALKTHAVQTLARGANVELLPGHEDKVHSGIATAPKCANVRRMRNPFAAKPLTRGRIALALVIAGATDALMIALGPIAWLPADEILDVMAMVAISLLIGFHPLLLPTFVLEVLPLSESLPTWTACVGAVLLWRKGSNSMETKPSHEPPTKTAQPPKPPEAKGPVIDV